MTPKPTTDEAESLPPLPRPFMEKFGRVSPEVYDPWADQMRTYALQAIASIKAPAAEGWVSVAERLPAPGQAVFVCVHEWDDNTNPLIVAQGVYCAPDLWQYTEDDSDGTLYAPVYWMPRKPNPHPPKEKT